MCSSEDHIDDDEVLLRRIPPTSDDFKTVMETIDGGLRATSGSMSTRRNETELSCSLLRLTTPKRLLENLDFHSIESSSWMVCRFLASDVRAVQLEVKHTPTEDDPGHCSITSESGLDFPKNSGKKLAKKTRILSQEEIAALSED